MEILIPGSQKISVGSCRFFLPSHLLAGRIFLLSFPLHGDVGNWLHLGALVASKPGRLTRRGNLLRFLLEILSVLDLLLNLGDQSLQVRNFPLGLLVLSLLKVADPGLEEVDGVLQALHGLIKLGVEALSDSQLVVSLGNDPSIFK